MYPSQNGFIFPYVPGENSKHILTLPPSITGLAQNLCLTWCCTMLCGPPHKAKLPAKDDGTPATPSWDSLPGPGISHGPYAKSCLHCHSMHFFTRETLSSLKLMINCYIKFHSYHKGKNCHLWNCHLWNCHLLHGKNCQMLHPKKTNGRFTWKKGALCSNPFCKWFWNGLNGYLNTEPNRVFGALGKNNTSTKKATSFFRFQPLLLGGCIFRKKHCNSKVQGEKLYQTTPPVKSNVKKQNLWQI